MKVAEFIAARLAHLGVTQGFSVTGGAAMHLNDAFGAEPGIDVRYMHHEQACAMAAEGYARLEWRPAVVVVTAGPGALNALNGVFGAFTDSIPMVVVSGQARSETLVSHSGNPALRQLGDQEARIVEVVAPVTKWVHQIQGATGIAEVVDRAFGLATSGRPGPVWLDVPVDVQGAQTDADPTVPDTFVVDPLVSVSDATLLALIARLDVADRPLLLVGTGVRAAGVADLVPELAERLDVPVVTAWTHDILPTGHRLNAGRPGTIGTRAGNFAVQSCDLLVVVGSRLNVRQVSYNWEAFAAGARVVMIDIDDAELSKPHLARVEGVRADLRDVLPRLVKLAGEGERAGQHESWIAWTQSNRAAHEPRPEDYEDRPGGINAYHLFMQLSRLLSGRHVVVSGDATACIVPFQTMTLADGQRLFSNSGCASMGYDLPAALGASTAVPDRPVVCLAGDGSVMMNVQELQTLSAWRADVLLMILDNGGYLSIKQTQRNFFGRDFGSAPDSGVTFPDFAAVARAFGLPTTVLAPGPGWREALAEVVDAHGPRVCVVILDRDQEFEPRLKSRMTTDGIVTPPLDDMFPFLTRATLEAVRTSAREVRNGATPDYPVASRMTEQQEENHGPVTGRP